MGEPRIRVSALLRWRGQILLCRHEKPGKEYWLLPGGGVDMGESLTDALQRELEEELGIDEEVPVEGPVCIVDSIAPKRTLSSKHVVHIVFAGDLPAARSRRCARRMRPFAATASSTLDELDTIVLHPPIQRFLRRWRPGDPVAYLGSLWVP